MQRPPDNLYAFGDFLLDPVEHRLLRSGEPVALTPKVFELLLVLVERQGRVIEKEQLMQLLWPDQYVEESNLKQSVSVLRKALGDVRTHPQYVETVPKVGYRFVADVAERQRVEHAQARHESDEAVEVAANTYSVSGTEKIDRPEDTERPSPYQLNRSKTAKPRTVLLVSLLTAAAVVSLGFAVYRSYTRAAPAQPFQKIEVTRLTNGGAWVPAVSPDGKFVAYVANDANMQNSVWIRETSTGHATRLVPADGVGYGGPVFSRASDYIYYSRNDLQNQSMYFLGDLYRVPVIGGEPQKLASNVSGTAYPSPDDKQLVLIRVDPSAQEYRVLVSNADGTGERLISARKFPGMIWGPGWSPDGKLLSYCARNHEGGRFYNTVMAVPVEGGPERPLTSGRWMDVGGAVWLQGGSGLLLTARERPGEPFQIYYVSYPGGEVRKVTNDVYSYSAVSVTADSKVLVAEVAELTSNIWVVPEGDVKRARQITQGGKDGVGGISWTPDGRIVYATVSRDSYNETGSTGDKSIWTVDADGRNRRRLTSNDGINSNPAVTPDGRYIVFSSYRDGEWAIWRMNMDGSEPRRLATGGTMTSPSCSPDGRWVVFRRLGPSRQPALWRVSIDGGEAVELTDKNAYPASVSPDGKLVAFFAVEETKTKLVLIPSEGGEPVRTFNVAPDGRFMLFTMITRWAGDGDLLTYIDNKREVSNIWGLPVRGGEPRQLTDFNSDSIFSFDWSRDGKQLATASGQLNRQIVLLRDSQDR